jgi:regulator of replication initiation timing
VLRRPGNVGFLGCFYTPFIGEPSVALWRSSSVLFMQPPILVILASERAGSLVKQVVVETYDSRLVLDYVKALVSLPLISLIGFLVFITLFKKPIGVFIKNIKTIKAGNNELTTRNFAAKLAKEVLKPELKEAAESPDKEEKEFQVMQQVTSLETRLNEALKTLYSSSPYTASDYGVYPPIILGGSSKPINLSRFTVNPRVRELVEPVIKAHITSTGSRVRNYNGGSMLELVDSEGLYEKCTAISPDLLALYGSKGAWGVINYIAESIAPHYEGQPPIS